MKQSFVLLFLIISIAPLHAQQNTEPESGFKAFCGNDLLPQDKASADQFNLKYREFKKNESAPASKAGEQYTIPVVIYEVNCSSFSPPLITPLQTEGQIEILNQFYAPYGIQFCLATKKGAQTLPGNPLPGMIRINAAQECTPSLYEHWEDVVGLSDLPHERYLRIFVCSGFMQPWFSGAAAFPWDPADRQAILIQSSAFGNKYNCGGCNPSPTSDLGRVLIHEVGHYLGLYHTFEGGCGNQGDDCNTQGDLLCDTPPDGLAYQDCPTDPAQYNCHPNAQPPLVNNTMTYSSEICRTSVTPQQIERMLYFLSNARASLVSPENLEYTGVICTPRSYCNIYASNSTPCVGETIQFDNFQYANTTYSWNFGDGSAPATGIPVTHAYTLPGHYAATLTYVRNGIAMVCTHDVYVGECTPINSSQGLWYFGALGGLDFSSGTPVAELSAYNNSTLNTLGSSIVQADGNNDLLYYSDGIKLFDAAHQHVNASQPLAGLSGVTQGGISIPVPGQNDRYYLFIPGSNGQLTYSTVVNTGSGVALSQVNKLVNPSISDYNQSGITAIPACDGTGYWILVTRTVSPAEVHVFKVDANGISLNSTFNSIVGLCSAIKASTDGSKVALCGGPFTLCDFDATTGILSNEKKADNYATFASFSPNSEIIYGIRGTTPSVTRVTQYQANAANPELTAVLLGSFNEVLRGAQLGPDGKIYLARNDQHRLGVINYPDLVATSNNNECGFTLYGPQLGQPKSTYGLPNFVDAGTDNCNSCEEEIIVDKECLQTGEGRYTSQVTLFYQGAPISMYNDPNCCVTWEYVNGIPSIACPRPNGLPDQNFNPIYLPQGQHYKVTIVCGDCRWIEEGYIDCLQPKSGYGRSPNNDGSDQIVHKTNQNSFATIYPNPAKNEIAIQLKQISDLTEIFTLQIYDAFGRLVLHHTLAGSDQWQLLDISGFTPGVYAWSLVGEGTEKVLEKGKIIVVP